MALLWDWCGVLGRHLSLAAQDVGVSAWKEQPLEAGITPPHDVRRFTVLMRYLDHFAGPNWRADPIASDHQVISNPCMHIDPQRSFPRSMAFWGSCQAVPRAESTESVSDRWLHRDENSLGRVRRQ
jgi:hypothetical protein